MVDALENEYRSDFFEALNIAGRQRVYKFHQEFYFNAQLFKNFRPTFEIATHVLHFSFGKIKYYADTNVPENFSDPTYVPGYLCPARRKQNFGLQFYF